MTETEDKPQYFYYACSPLTEFKPLSPQEAADMISSLQKQNTKLAAAANEMHKALDWYANHVNYNKNGAPGHKIVRLKMNRPEHEFIFDAGQQARDTLHTVDPYLPPTTKEAG